LSSRIIEVDRIISYIGRFELTSFSTRLELLIQLPIALVPYAEILLQSLVTVPTSQEFHDVVPVVGVLSI